MRKFYLVCPVPSRLQQYWSRDAPYKYVPVSVFAAAFNDFEVGLAIRKELSVPPEKSAIPADALAKTKYGAPQYEIFKACLDREWTLMRRTKFLYIFKTFQVGLWADLESNSRMFLIFGCRARFLWRFCTEYGQQCGEPYSCTFSRRFRWVCGGGIEFA